MLSIREEQYVVLGQVVLQKYKDDLLEHFRDYAPALFDVVGEDGFREFIDFGVEKATNIGLLLRGPMRLHLDLMCDFGLEFETDPQYRRLWPEGVPAEIPMPFAQRLHANMTDYLEHCVGPDKTILAHALQGFLAMPLESGEPFANWAYGELKDAYPEKLDYIGTDNFADFIEACEVEAAEVQLTTPRGRFLVVILAMFFGLGFFRNPLYPWIRKRLKNEASEEQRITDTWQALRTYAAAMLENIGK